MNAVQKRARVQSFLAQYDLELQHACLLTGGPPALRRLQRFRRSVALAERLSSSHRRELDWLQRLLRNDGIDREEAGYHVEIDPSDPAIYMLCELIEAVEALITELGKPGHIATVSSINAA